MSLVRCRSVCACGGGGGGGGETDGINFELI